MDGRLIRELAELIAAQETTVERLKACLAEERQLVAARDTDALQPVLRDKVDHFRALEVAEARRAELLRAADQPESPTELAGLLERQADRGDLARRWEALLASLRECRDRNEANGHIIRQQQRQVETVLTALRGTGDPAPSSYTSRGTHNSGPGREISRA